MVLLLRTEKKKKLFNHFHHSRDQMDSNKKLFANIYYNHGIIAFILRASIGNKIK